MRILFTTTHLNTPSTVFNQANFARLAEEPGVSVTMGGRDYAGHDVILFMAYDPDVATARRENPAARIGIVDIRDTLPPGQEPADFALVNGPEMRDAVAGEFSNVFEYPIFPELPPAALGRGESGGPLVVAYHGNKIHLQEMVPGVTAALEALADERPVELLAVYNVDELGPPVMPLTRHPGLSVRIEPWAPDVYTRVLARADIGLVPATVPLPDMKAALRSLAFAPGVYSEYATDHLVRYKRTTNSGRLFVFAQLGIPVVADMVPSHCGLIRHGENGFLAQNPAGWYQSLAALARDPELRRACAVRLRADFDARHSVAGTNRRLLAFLRGMPPARRAPARLRELAAGHAEVARVSRALAAKPRASLLSRLFRRS